MKSNGSWGEGKRYIKLKPSGGMEKISGEEIDMKRRQCFVFKSWFAGLSVSVV